MPSASATSFWVISSPPSRPKRIFIIRCSRWGSLLKEFFKSSRSTPPSMSEYTLSASVPITSERSSSLPSQSVFRGSSNETSCRTRDIRRRYISISFSIQREAYVASFMFLSERKEFMALIRPIVPTDTRSSPSMPEPSNFLAMYTTRRRLCSTSAAFAFSSPLSRREILSLSSSCEKGRGSASLPQM